jgi:hypothetical protein
MDVLRNQPRSLSMVRIALLSLVVLFVSLAGHSAASGSLPDATAIALGGAATLSLTVAFAKARRSLLSLLFYVSSMQLLLHTISSLTSHHDQHSLLPSASMLTFHLLASICAVLVVAFGNQALDLIFSLWRRILWQPRLTALVAREIRGIRRTTPGIHSGLFKYEIWHRGPPTLAVAIFH